MREWQEGAPIPTVPEPVVSSEVFRRNWARRIRKVCETDPLVCPRCQKSILTKAGKRARCADPECGYDTSLEDAEQRLAGRMAMV